MTNWLDKYLNARADGLLEPADTLVIWQVYVRGTSYLVTQELSRDAYPLLTTAALPEVPLIRAHVFQATPQRQPARRPAGG